MAEEQNAEEAPAGGKKKLIFIIVGALLLVGISIGVTLVLFSGGEEEEQVVEVDTGPEKGPPVYTELEAFTVNLEPQDPVDYLRVEIKVLSYYEDVTAQLVKHKPLIRNDLTVLFAQQKSTDLRTEEGKQKLQQAVLEKIQSAIDRYGKGGEVANAFFVDFVMQ
jgi:flagellar FliL protein